MKEPNRSTTEIWVLLNVAHRTLAQRFDTRLRRAGLPPAAWYDVLWPLEVASRESDGIRQNELQKYCIYDQPNLSRNIARMVDDGLVERRPAPDDARGRILSLTEKGRELRRRMWADYSALMLAEIEDKMDAETAAGLIRGLKALVPEFSLPEDDADCG